MMIYRQKNEKTKRRADEEESGESIEKRVEAFSHAIAPVLLPMISSLGALELENALQESSSAATA